jgi:hypothetical protein
VGASSKAAAHVRQYVADSSEMAHSGQQAEPQSMHPKL